jgi:protein arginine kinase activator
MRPVARKSFIDNPQNAHLPASVLGELRERLRRAIEQEQFEVAAELRDRIRVLE